jgi:thymidylate synthase
METKMREYLDSLATVLKDGETRNDRTNTGTISLFGMQTRYDISKTFPAVTTKRLAWKAMVSELLWFIEGSGDERRLAEILHGTRDAEKKTIWTDNANADYWKGTNGDIGRGYGVQWRTWQRFRPVSTKDGDGLLVGTIEEVDQIANLIKDIQTDPYSRRQILTAWNPGELDDMALPPCHILSQFYVTPYSLEKRMELFELRYPTASGVKNGYVDKEKMCNTYEIPKGRLSCQMYQRSADFFLGVPFNIASYSLLTAMIAQVTGLEVREFIHTIGDAHIYLNHVDQVNEQLSRVPVAGPTLWLNPAIKNIDDFTIDDIKLENYVCMDAIAAKMAV